MTRIWRFFRSVYHDNDRRLTDTRGLSSDVARYAVNWLLRPVEHVLIRRFQNPDVPIIFIVGVPRSGSTLLYQLVARHLDVGFVDNCMARYWMAPVLGGIRCGRWRDGTGLAHLPLESRAGTTPTRSSPHEFSWFWEFWTAFGDRDEYSERELAQMPWDCVQAELESLAGWFGTPFVIKSINYTNYHVAWIARLMAQARFLWIRRSPPYVARSIYETRLLRYGNPSSWWSVRPADHAQWAERPPAEQIAHQIHDITAAIDRGRCAMPANRFMMVEYEEMVGDPAGTLERVAEFIPVPWRTAWRPERLENRNRQRVEDEVFHKLVTALADVR